MTPKRQLGMIFPKLELREDIDLALNDIGTYVAELHIDNSSTSD